MKRKFYYNKNNNNESLYNNNDNNESLYNNNEIKNKSNINSPITVFIFLLFYIISGIIAYLIVL